MISAPAAILRRPLVWKRHRGVAPADVVLGSYPRSGGTWLAIMLAELLTSASFDLRSGDDSVPMVGEGTPRVILPDGGRLIRTHEPYRREYRRSILLVRDPRDVVVSYFHFQRDRLKTFSGSLDDFVSAFVRGRVDHYGPWRDHVASWLAGGQPQVTVRYEDLLDDPARELTRLVEFLTGRPDPTAIRDVVAANSFDEMRAKEERSAEALPAWEGAGARFVRSGTAGGWRDTLEPAPRDAIERSMQPQMGRLGYR